MEVQLFQGANKELPVNCAFEIERDSLYATEITCTYLYMLLHRLAQTVAGWQAACEDRQNF